MLPKRIAENPLRSQIQDSDSPANFGKKKQAPSFARASGSGSHVGAADGIVLAGGFALWHSLEGESGSVPWRGELATCEQHTNEHQRLSKTLSHPYHLGRMIPADDCLGKIC